MKTYIMATILFLLLIPFIFADCTGAKNPVDSPFKNRFAIYFLQDSNLTYRDVVNQSINSLKLSSPPMATEDFIDYYKIFNKLAHAIIFKKEMKQIFGNANRPIIIVANGDRIYVGEYWANFMNTMPPDILIYPYKNNEFHILSNESGIEKINDQRIINYLKESGIKIVYEALAKQ